MSILSGKGMYQLYFSEFVLSFIHSLGDFDQCICSGKCSRINFSSITVCALLIILQKIHQVMSPLWIITNVCYFSLSGPKQFGWKSFVWFFGAKDKGDAPNDSPSMKTRIGGSGQSHLAMVFENVDTRIYKTRHFKKQIMCSVYDAYNQWLQV